MKKLLLIDRSEECGLIKSRDIEYFGPWAQPIDSPQDLLKASFSPYIDSNSVSLAYANARDTAKHIITILSDLMPALTGVKVGDRFWKPYLIFHVASLAGIYEDIKNRWISLPKHEFTLGMPHDEWENNGIPFSWEEARELLFNNDSFRRKIISDFLKDRLTSHEVVHYASFPKKNISKNEQLLFRKIMNRWTLRKLSNYIGALNPFQNKVTTSTSLIWDTYNIDKYQFQKIKVDVFSHFCLPKLNLNKSFRPDKEKRAAIKNSLAFPYGELISSTLPLCALELLHRQVELLEKYSYKYFSSVKKIYTHGQFCVEEDPKRALMCLLAEKGKRLISVQHGGAVYSSDPVLLLESACDEYISWGEGYQYNDTLPNARAMPSIYLSFLKKQAQINKYRETRETLLVVLEENRFFKYLYNPVFPDMAYDYFKRQKELLDFFSLKKKVAVKVYPWDYGWGQAKWIKKEFPGIALLTSGKFSDYALRSKLVIIDYNGTTILEMLAMNLPFLFTWNRHWFKSIDTFERSLDKLKAVGVFHENPAALISAYNTITSVGVDVWWGNSDRQTALKDIAGEFALTSDHWDDLWQQEFKKC